MSYKTAKVYSGSEWVDLAIAIPDVSQRTIGNVTGTSYTFSLFDTGKTLVFSNSSSISLTVPLESSANFAIGQMFTILQKGTGQITISGSVGVTINSLSGNNKISGQYGEARLVKIASNEWLLSGDLTS